MSEVSCGTNWGNVISWALVIAGWWLLNRQHNKRETRKEVRSSLNEIKTLINKIEEDAIAYHTGATTAPILARRLKRDLNQLYPLLDLSISRVKKNNNFTREVSAFRQAITLNNFETAEHRQLQLPNDVLDGIAATKDRLVLKMEREFQECFSN